MNAAAVTREKKLSIGTHVSIPLETFILTLTQILGVKKGKEYLRWLNKLVDHKI
jgi:hypothetical protein